MSPEQWDLFMARVVLVCMWGGTLIVCGFIAVSIIVWVRAGLRAWRRHRAWQHFGRHT